MDQVDKLVLISPVGHLPVLLFIDSILDFVVSFLLSVITDKTNSQDTSYLLRFHAHL